MPRPRRSCPRFGFALIGSLALLACEARPAPRTAYDAAPISSETSDQGLEIAVIHPGAGDPVRAGDWISVHYILELDGGAQVDDSHSQKPLTFHVGADTHLIEGMHLGVVGMRPGELRRLTIPAELGYKSRAYGQIPANSRLTFFVELIRRKPG